MNAEVLRTERKDKIFILTLNRPERLNAFNLELKQRLEDAWKTFEKDEDLWVAILTGSGDRAFCAGEDLVERKELKPGARRPSAPGPRRSPVGVWKPVIAAINGHAIGGGFQLAKDCDMRIAAEHAEFGIGETRWNLAGPWTYDMIRVIPRGLALELCLWGDGRMSAQRAYEIGFVNRVVPRGKVMEEAMAWAERMCYLGPRAVADMKQIIYRGANWGMGDGPANGWAIIQNLDGMEDSSEGPKSFAEKRNPAFKNR